MRHRLTQLLSKMEGNDKLDQLLADILSNTDKAKALAKEMGIESPDATSTEDQVMSSAEQAQAAAAAAADDRGPQPARPGDRGHPAADRTRSRSAPRTTSSSSSTRSSSRARWSPRTSRPTSRTGSREIDKKLTAQLNEIMHDPDFQKLEVDLARPALPGQPDRDRRRRSRSGC